MGILGVLFLSLHSVELPTCITDLNGLRSHLSREVSIFSPKFSSVGFSESPVKT